MCRLSTVFEKINFIGRLYVLKYGASSKIDFTKFPYFQKYDTFDIYNENT